MVFDTNVIIRHIRRSQYLDARAIIPVVVAGELRAFALKSDWGAQKVAFLEELLSRYPLLDINDDLTHTYALLDAFSQGKLNYQPLSPGTSARNMGKNDFWIASIAVYFDLALHITDNDFDHLPTMGLRLVKE